jgi:AraC family transcriptional regulator, arabinose operon regulatory protein
LQDKLDILLRNADLNILECDIHMRNEMDTYNRILPYYVMSYQKNGEAKLRIRNKIYDISPGTVIIIPPNVEHDHFKETAEQTVFLWFHFIYGIANVIDVLKIFNFPITFKLKNSDVFEKVFVQYKEASTQTNFLSATILRKAKAYELLYLLLEGIINSNGSLEDQYKYDGFLNILAQVLKSPERELSLQDLSRQFHLHPTYISNRFKELFGKSPIQVQRELKVNRAKKLLKSSELSVTEIAQSIGFSSMPGFTRLFKTYVGISPTQYRNLNKKFVNPS